MRSMQWQLGILGTISPFAYRHSETKKNLRRDGRSQDLPNTDFQPAILLHIFLHIVYILYTYNFLHSPVTSSLIGLNILNALFSNTLSLHSSRNISDQVLHPYKKTGKITVQILQIFKLNKKYVDALYCKYDIQLLLLCLVDRASLYNLFQMKPTRCTLLLSIFISNSLHVSSDYVPIIWRTYCLRQPPVQSAKYQCRIHTVILPMMGTYLLTYLLTYSMVQSPS